MTRSELVADLRAYRSVTPAWIRYLDVTSVPPTVLEWDQAALTELRRELTVSPAVCAQRNAVHCTERSV